MSASGKGKYILQELFQHLPYTIFGVMIALLCLAFLTFLAIVLGGEDRMPGASQEVFHMFHAAHILLSAVATTAMFHKHEGNMLKAVAVGFIGSVGICALSDIYFPFFGGILVGLDMHLHLCIVEEPELVFPFALVGVLAGLATSGAFERATEFSHSIHVFVSAVASILYLMGYGLTDWLHAITAVFVITIVAVMIPCCLSDIVFPLACSHRNCHHPPAEEGHHHHHGA